MKRDTLHIMTGPTGVGKTALALDWARQHGAEIVSCDSLLFYRGMDIGTAKPSAGERAQIPHHLIDCAPVTEQLNVGDYCRLARAAVEAIQARGRRVLVVGGSGFYLKAFFAAVVDDTQVPEAVRVQVAQWEGEGGLALLLERLRALSPSGTGRLDVNNPRRVARALERCLASGLSVPELEEDFARRSGAFDEWPKETTLLLREKAELEQRIRTRTARMLADGLVEEVKSLREIGLEQNPSAAGAIGYRETLAWLDRGGSLPELEEAINISTRQLVAKQLKWFRTQLRPAHVRNL